jgi:choline dehydrogenase-like flavoprotein
MLIDAERLIDGSILESDVTIVGAGAAGIVLAIELGRMGVDVLLIESGHGRYSARIQALADTDHYDPQCHDRICLIRAGR